MLQVAFLVSLSIASVQSQYHSIERMSPKGTTQSCTVQGGGRQCCSATASGELGAVTLCWDMDTQRVEVNAGNYGYFKISTYEEDGKAPYYGYRYYYGYFNTDAGKAKWPMYGGEEKISIRNGRLCHGSQCCDMGQTWRSAANACQAGAVGNSDAISMGVDDKWDQRFGAGGKPTMSVTTQPAANKPYGSTHYEVTVSGFEGLEQWQWGSANGDAFIQGQGGPFYNEAIKVTYMRATVGNTTMV